MNEPGLTNISKRSSSKTVKMKMKQSNVAKELEIRAKGEAGESQRARGCRTRNVQRTMLLRLSTLPNDERAMYVVKCQYLQHGDDDRC